MHDGSPRLDAADLAETAEVLKRRRETGRKDKCSAISDSLNSWIKMQSLGTSEVVCGASLLSSGQPAGFSSELNLAPPRYPST